MPALWAALGPQRRAGRLQRAHVAVDGAHRDLELLGQPGGGDRALLLDAQEDGDEAAGTHAASVGIIPDTGCQGWGARLAP